MGLKALLTAICLMVFNSLLELSADREVDEGRSLHKEEDPRYRGAEIPSKAFRLLQSMTDGSKYTPSPSASASSTYTSPSSVPQNSGTASGSPHVRTIPIQIEGEPPKKYIPPSEQTVPEPKKYTGSAIPSRSFKILQAMTAPDNCAYANEVSENINDPNMMNYPYPFDPNYPYPPPYWYDPYYNSYYYQYNPSDLSGAENETNDRSSSREDSKTPTNEDERRKGEVKMNPRQTPVPFMGYYPQPYMARPLRTPTTDVESEDESYASSRKTPLPYWGYHTPYYHSYTPTPFMEQYNGKGDEDNATEEQYDDGAVYPPCPPYWDPYYYPYYYGYPPPPPPPPIYSPYPFYGYPNDEDMAGYSSTDEMALYAQRFAQENYNQRRKSQTPRIVITPTAEVEKSIKEKDMKKCEYDSKHKTINRDKKDEIIPDKASKEEEYRKKEEHKERDDYDMTDTETEKYSSDSESENDTERNSPRDKTFNSLHSMKSVPDIGVYTTNAVSDSSSSSEGEEEEESESINEDSSSVCYVDEEQMPHQLSVIYEESERTDTSRLSHHTRSMSMCSNASTIADKTEEIEDEVCTAVSLKLPVRKKSTDGGADIESDVSVEVTLKSPSMTPKNERSPCRLDEDFNEEEDEIKDILHTTGSQDKDGTMKAFDTRDELLSQIQELRNTLNKSAMIFDINDEDEDEDEHLVSKDISDENKDKLSDDKSIFDNGIDQNITSNGEEEVDFWAVVGRDKSCIHINKIIEEHEDDSTRLNAEEEKEFKLEFRNDEEIPSTNNNLNEPENTENNIEEEGTSDDSLDFWSIINKDEDDISSKKTKQNSCGQANTAESEIYDEENEINNENIDTECSVVDRKPNGGKTVPDDTFGESKNEQCAVTTENSQNNGEDKNFDGYGKEKDVQNIEFEEEEMKNEKNEKAIKPQNGEIAKDKEASIIKDSESIKGSNTKKAKDSTKIDITNHENDSHHGDNELLLNEEGSAEKIDSINVDSTGSRLSSCSMSQSSEQKVVENVTYHKDTDVKIDVRKTYSKEKCNEILEDSKTYSTREITATIGAQNCHAKEKMGITTFTNEGADALIKVNQTICQEKTKILVGKTDPQNIEELCVKLRNKQPSSVTEDDSRRVSHHYLDTDESSSGSESEDEAEENEVNKKKEEEKETEAVEEYPQPLSIKERIAALQESVRQKQNMFKRRDEDSNQKATPKEKISNLEVSDNQNVSKTTSTKSSLRSFEELSEEEVDSGVTSDMSRHISDSEEFPELGKMSRYERAATHSRLFKLLQEECSEDEREDEALEIQQSDDKFSKLSVRKQQEEQESSNNDNRKNMLSLPLNKQNEDTPPEVPPNISEKLVNELIQSMLKQKKGKIFKSMSMNKIKAAAIKILLEDNDDEETSEDLSSFMMTSTASTGDSTAAQTPQEFYTTNDYRAYYESWKDAENFEILPSKAFKLIQEHAGSNKSGIIAGLSAKCPRILSSKSVNKEMLDLAESSEDNPTPTPETSLERNEVISAS